MWSYLKHSVTALILSANVHYQHTNWMYFTHHVVTPDTGGVG